MHAAAPAPDDPELLALPVPLPPPPVPELLPAPMPDPEDPELPKTALEPSGEFVDGEVPLLLLPQAARPVETARPEMVRRRRRDCIGLLWYPWM